MSQAQPGPSTNNAVELTFNSAEIDEISKSSAATGSETSLFLDYRSVASSTSSSSLSRFDVKNLTSSSSSEFDEHLDLFHKFDYLRRSPVAGLQYEQIVHDFNVIQTVDPDGAQGAIGIQEFEHQAFAGQSNDITNGQFLNNKITVIQSKIMPPQPQMKGAEHNAFVSIVEQPASKALRFRYECEGRSAGSIPGANSTPENKTFPTIQVIGAKGRAVVVVSCVTKDEPHRPHPHNLVGKEGCKKGVCTLEINNEDMTVSFSNLGIQCVKKKDIEDALRIREDIRVDPFRSKSLLESNPHNQFHYPAGFQHKTNPSTIDLNVVRLCFQVFLEGDRGKFTRPLPAVVSEPIFDKKAMSDLTITKLSDCTSPANGGRDIILLCEKVAKEDIAIRFFEERNGGRSVWHAQGDFQHQNVHKQVAIAFKTPPYENERIDEPVRVKVQLLRPSDGAVSDPLPFVYTPMHSGRERFKSLREDIKRMANIDIFQQIVVNNLEANTQLQDANNNFSLIHNNNLLNNELVPEQETVICLDTPVEAERPLIPDEPPGELEPESQFEQMDEDDKTLHELLEQVAELDEIYTDHQMRHEVSNDGERPEKMDVDFDDAATYSSLQKAFKNPITLTVGPPIPPRPVQIDTHYDEVEPMIPRHPDMSFGEPVVPQAPIIDVQSLKRSNLNVKNHNNKEEEKVPPLPPKRKREHEAPDKENNIEQELVDLERARRTSTRPQSQIIIKPADPPKIPPKPTTLPRKQKQGFFSRIFRRKSKPEKSATAPVTPAESREPSMLNVELLAPPPNLLDRPNSRSFKTSAEKRSRPVGRSVSSVSESGSELRRKKQRVSQSGDIFDPTSPDNRPNAAFQTVSPNLRAIKNEPRDQTPSPFAPPLFGGTMTVNQQFDYRNPQATPTPSPQPQLHPFSVSPQPNQLGGGMFQPFGANTSPQFNPQQPFVHHHQHSLHPHYPEGNFPLNFMPPLPNNSNVLTPVPATMESVASMNLPANLGSFAQNDLPMNMDSMEGFNLNSSDLKRILKDNDFSTGLSSEQTRDPRDTRGFDDKDLSDSFSKLL